MFCLRSWIPILFFLKNASPIYLILFISATYVLNRPCVYCSLLLAILVVSLFDFNADWFDPAPLAAQQLQANASTISDALLHATSSMLPDYIVSGVASVMSAATNNVVADVADFAISAVTSRTNANVTGVDGPLLEWIRGMLRKEWRIQCLDLVLRL